MRVPCFSTSQSTLNHNSWGSNRNSSELDSPLKQHFFSGNWGGISSDHRAPGKFFCKVLKNLSDTWDDDSVERLMNKADKTLGPSSAGFLEEGGETHRKI
jgi:hypothetical protein